MGYHPGLFAVYVRAAKRHLTNEIKEKLTDQAMNARAVWVGTNTNHEGLVEYTEALENHVVGDSSSGKKKELSSAEVRSNWLKFGQALGAM